VKEEPFYLVIPAAGLGKRMKAVNPEIPKEMLHVGSKPAIQYAVEEGISAGIKNIIIVINQQKEVIRKYFEDKRFGEDAFSCSITFLYQENPMGESDAIYLAKDVVGDHSVAIIYPDNLYFPAPGALMSLKTAFKKYKTDILALMEVNDENAKGISNSGKVDIESFRDTVYRIKRFYQKGEGHYVLRIQEELRTCGIMISGPHIFDYIERAHGSIKEDEEFTDTPVRMLILKERELLGCRLPGTVFDIGNPTGYELCLSYVKRTLGRED
jgi:UTP--glucose-1-phosphate uridylyltransferase